MTTTDYREHYQAAFDALTDRLTEPDWMVALRRSAFDSFVELGLPNRKVEAWKYTSLRSFSKKRYTVPTTVNDSAGLVATSGEAIATIAIVDGRVALGSSDLGRLPSGVTVRPLAEAWDAARPMLEERYASFDNGFLALQAAFSVDGVFVDVGNGVAIDGYIEVLRADTAAGSITPSLLLVRVGRTAEASILERCTSADEDLLSGGLTEIQLEDGANLRHAIAQYISESATRYASTRATVARDAAYNTVNVGVGGALSRDDLEITLAGKGADTTLSALCLGRERQHQDHVTLVDHAVEHTTSDQLYKTVLDDRSVCAFAGTVIVRRDAQKIAAEQLNNNLLLTDDARIYTRPQLEIAADDVTCGHGATIGQLPEEEIFYLMSRAIPRERARRLVIGGFAVEPILKLGGSLADALTDEVRALLEDRI